jgi:hypothetical protein
MKWFDIFLAYLQCSSLMKIHTHKEDLFDPYKYFEVCINHNSHNLLLAWDRSFYF